MNTLQRTLATLALFAVAFSFTTRASAALPAKGTEILWDRYGIPHIFASDHASLFYAYGYAQMEAHSELLVRLYTQARGRAAELYGEQYLDSDRWVRVNGIPERAKQWATRQSPNRHPTVRNRRRTEIFVRRCGALRQCRDSFVPERRHWIDPRGPPRRQIAGERRHC